MSNTSSCVNDARLNLSGTRLEGTYRNVQFGTMGVIAGIYDPEILKAWIWIVIWRNTQVLV